MLPCKATTKEAPLRNCQEDRRRRGRTWVSVLVGSKEGTHTYKMASGDNVDVIEVVETSFTGPAQTTEDHLRPEQSTDEDSE